MVVEKKWWQKDRPSCDGFLNISKVFKKYGSTDMCSYDRPYAKTKYLLSMGKLFKDRKEKVLHIVIFLSDIADSLKLMTIGFLCISHLFNASLLTIDK